MGFVFRDNLASSGGDLLSGGSEAQALRSAVGGLAIYQASFLKLKREGGHIGPLDSEVTAQIALGDAGVGFDNQQYRRIYQGEGQDVQPVGKIAVYGDGGLPKSIADKAFQRVVQTLGGCLRGVHARIMKKALEGGNQYCYET